MAAILNNGNILVNTTNGVEVPNGFALISANLRETKGNPVSPETRYRNVVIPEFTLPESVDKKFQQVLLDKFYNLAKAYLESVMDETNRMAREIPVTDFSIDNLLGFFGRVATSSRLSGETVAAWFDASKTGARLMEKAKARGDAGPALLKKYRDMFIKTASPNHGIHPEDCSTLLAMMDESEVESGIGAQLVSKWSATIEKMAKSERLEAL